MNIAPKSVENYCLEHSSKPSELLEKIERETYLKTTRPHMISGKLQGALLGNVTSMLGVKNALEIGTFTGYSTIWVAENLAKDGVITTIEVNEEVHWLANQYFKEFKEPHKIHSILGDATEIIPNLDQIWDFILIDAGKVDNEKYYEMVLPHLRSGGYIVVDNVLWKSKLLDGQTDKRTVKIDSFNKKIANDPRVASLLLPLRDGITLIRKL